jgi:1-acyl-sn-glycerol-3-phosphate acyltransferase
MNPVARIFYTLRSILFLIGQVVITVFFSATGVLISPFVSPYNNGRYFVVGNWLIIKWLRVCCGVRLKIEGQMPSPKAPFVVMANHQSQWETFFLQWYLFPVATVLKKELLSIPFFGTALKTMKSIGIDRDNPRASIRQIMEEGVDRISNNYNLLIFPEGTRMPPGQFGNFARGGAGISIKADVPIIPIAHNAGRCWPAKSHVIQPGLITVVVGEPIYPEGREAKQLTQDVAEWIKQQCERIG